MGSLTLYFDRCFGRSFPEEVERLKPPFKVESHKKMGFRHDTADDEWLHIVGQKRWIVLSHDAKFHMDSPALEAIRQHKIGCFYLWGAQMPVWDKIRLLTAAYSKIAKIASSEKRPYIYRVNQNNRVLLVRHWDGRKEPKKYTGASAQVPRGGATA